MTRRLSEITLVTGIISFQRERQLLRNLNNVQPANTKMLHSGNDIVIQKITSLQLRSMS